MVSRVLVVLFGLCLASSIAAEEHRPAVTCAGVSVESLARLMLQQSGPQELLVAQALRGADAPTLVALQRALRDVASDLEEARRRRPSEGAQPAAWVQLEIRMLDMPPSFVRDVGVDFGGKGSRPPRLGEPGSQTLSYLDDTQLEVILRAVEKIERIALVTAPRVLVKDRQRADVSVLKQRSVVVDAEAVDAGDGALVARPVRATVREGHVLNVRPTLSRDRRYVTLELSLVRAQLVERPARSIQCAGKAIQLTMPRTQLDIVRATMRVPDEGTILLDPGHRVGGKARVLLITPRHVARANPERHKPR